MEYRKFGNTIIARLDKGEEILEQLQNIAVAEKIKLAGIQALGAVNKFTAGVYDTNLKKYFANEFEGTFEIVSLTGTVNTMNGEFYSHLHMSAGNDRGEVFGGHLNKAFVSATCEMVITVIDGTVDRLFDDEIGLNLFKF
ncbi:MAG: DNA-binding protein [Clostridiales bacterium]|nr:DNA-binding protein [Bacillota bacterium]MEE0517852.1 PPC domain-containing DNA-binding protein [Anaerovoracaceae bacterium]PWL94242.1 MAG: DNA-binding protein [Clostridiales bacterium]